MKTWFKYLQQGLSRDLPQDRISDPGKKYDFKGDLKTIYPYLSRHRRRILAGLAIIIVAALLAFPSPLITRYLIDDIILKGQINFLIGAILLLITVLVAEKLARVLEEFYFARLEQRLTLDIHQDLIARVLRLPKAFFDDNQTGYLMSRLTEDVHGLRWFFSGSIVYFISNILRFIGGVALLLYLEWRLSVAVLILLPGLGFILRYFSKRMHVLSHRNREQWARVSSDFQESLSEADLIKSFASEQDTQKRLMSSLTSIFQISLEQVTVNSVAGLIINSMPGIARALTLAVGAYWIIKDQWTLGSLLAYQAYLAYVFGPAQFIASANLQLQEARAALERVSALFEIVPEENMGSGKMAERLNGEIEFKNVSFAYTDSAPVLKNISLHVHPGEKIAIVGPSGVGKTTLMSLMLRFYQPTSGEIYFDGRPACTYDVSSLRKRIGYVSQQPRLLDGTVRENLCYGNPDATKDQVMQAARTSGMHDVIQILPQGYETRIGENGIRLSEGQKQRLSIARALIKNPDILILDEPTAALDSKAEKSLFDLLPQMFHQKTMFFVTHRPSAILRSDRILLLSENQLIDIGTHQSLLDSNDYFREIIAHQQSNLGREFPLKN
ncbi:MAG: ABC transporter ATP-binding protein [Desulfobacterales bacterium]|jgi:ABC-type multidrug transport system fused ATPase/permease subunit